jgi:hypothetical protein
VKKRVDG